LREGTEEIEEGETMAKELSHDRLREILRHYGRLAE
jgi:hypothetical protein